MKLLNLNIKYARSSGRQVVTTYNQVDQKKINNNRIILPKISTWGLAVFSSIGIWDPAPLYAAPATVNPLPGTPYHEAVRHNLSLPKHAGGKRGQGIPKNSSGKFLLNRSHQSYFVHHPVLNTLHKKKVNFHLRNYSVNSKKTVNRTQLGLSKNHINGWNHINGTRMIEGAPQFGEYASASRVVSSRFLQHFFMKKDYHTTAVRAALSRIGAPYRWGSSGPNTFDCSGLIVWSYKHSGITLPRSTWGQMTVGKPVHSIAQLKPADLVITDGGGHVGMYIGNGMMVHAPDEGDRVKIVPVDSLRIYAMRHI